MSGIYSLTVNELKKEAERGKILNYKSKRTKKELINHILNNGNIKTLKSIGKNVNLKKYYIMNKDDLIKKLNPKDDEFIRDVSMTMIKSKRKNKQLETLEKKFFKKIKNDMVYLDKIIDVEKYAKKGFTPYKKSKTTLTKINKNTKLKNKHIASLKRKGRVEIHSKKELQNFPLGSLVSYVTKEGLYRSGGFLKHIGDQYFVLQGGEITHPISFPVQFKNIDKMFVKNKETVEENKENQKQLLKENE